VNDIISAPTQTFTSTDVPKTIPDYPTRGFRPRWRCRACRRSAG
jgi:hypothetical protein